MKPSPSELRFASFLSYSPRGETNEAARSRNFVLQLKEGKILSTDRGEMPAAAYAARRIRETPLEFKGEFLGAGSALVPVPRSALLVRGALWPAAEIAEALAREGFGSGVVRCLVRRHAVTKAATATRETRPTARDHFDSLAVVEPLSLPAKVTLIDDVVTRGAQLWGAACRIWKARADVEVVGFAVIRTISGRTEFERILAPCVGRIWLERGRCIRRP